MTHPVFVGALVMGILLNLALIILATFDFTFWDALFIAATAMALAASILMQRLIRRSGKEER